MISADVAQYTGNAPRKMLPSSLPISEKINNPYKNRLLTKYNVHSFWH